MAWLVRKQLTPLGKEDGKTNRDQAGNGRRYFKKPDVCTSAGAQNTPVKFFKELTDVIRGHHYLRLREESLRARK